MINFARFNSIFSLTDYFDSESKCIVPNFFHGNVRIF